MQQQDIVSTKQAFAQFSSLPLNRDNAETLTSLAQDIDIGIQRIRESTAKDVYLKQQVKLYLSNEKNNGDENWLEFTNRFLDELSDSEIKMFKPYSLFRLKISGFKDTITDPKLDFDVQADYFAQQQAIQIVESRKYGQSIKDAGADGIPNIQMGGAHWAEMLAKEFVEQRKQYRAREMQEREDGY